ncbi:MAG: hypothetical protein ACOX3K_04235 [Bacilli bacterium]|jgi:hypothetical protein
MINNATSTGLFIAVFLFLMIDLFASYESFRRQQSLPFNFWNSLPFELSQGADKNFRPLHYGLIFLTFGSFILFPFVVLPASAANFYYSIIIYVMMTISGLVMSSLFIINMNNYRLHILAVAILFASTIGEAVGLCLYLLKSPFGPYPQILGFLALIPGILTLLLAFNPRLSKWPIMDKRELQDGTIQILRPKRFVLAYTEWALIILNLAFLLYFFIVTVI